MAKVKENHMDRHLFCDNVKWLWTRCRIEQARRYNPTASYRMTQLDRRWDHALLPSARKIIVQIDCSGLGAVGNDETVMSLEEAESKNIVANQVL